MNAAFDPNKLIREYTGPLTAGAIIRLGIHLGWQEQSNRGKGSHRCLVRPGYRAVVVPCHGEGHELDKGLVHQLLNRLCKPFQSTDPDLPEKIISQFQTWLANEHTHFESSARVELERLATQSAAQLRQQEEILLAETDELLQQLLAAEVAKQVERRLELEADLQQQIQAAQAAQAAQVELNAQLQRMSEEQQRLLNESSLASGQQNHVLTKYRRHISDLEKACSQARMDAQRHKRECQITLVSAITAAIVVSLPAAPNWLKSSTVLAIPVITGIGSKRKLYSHKALE